MRMVGEGARTTTGGKRGGKVFVGGVELEDQGVGMEGGEMSGLWKR